MSRCAVRWAILVAVGVLVVGIRAAGAQPLPITVDADTITYDSAQQVVTARGNVRVTIRRYRLFADALRYDLRREVAVATGRVRLLDDRDRELRGQSLTFNTRTEDGILEPIEGIVDRARRIYIRGSRLEFSPDRLVTHESQVTTCDPRQPALFVTARRIEIVPNQRVVAYEAAVYAGSRRLYGTARFEASLVPGDEPVLVPRVGTNDTDGVWLDHRVRVRIGEAAGLLHVKYGTLSGPFALLSLTRPYPTLAVTLRAGRTQTSDDRAAFNLRTYDTAEIVARTVPVRIGTSPVSWTAFGAAGWVSEPAIGVATTRMEAGVGLALAAVPVAPRLTLTGSASFRAAHYGTGAVRTVTTVRPSLNLEIDRYTTLGVAASLVAVGGATPFTIDTVDREQTISLGATRAVPDRYRVAAAVVRDMVVPETRLVASAAVAVSRSVDLGIAVEYNTRLGTFQDVDYTLRVICDCADVVVQYRQVRRELSLSFGLVGFTERRGSFVPRTVPPAFFPEDADRQGG